MRRASSPSGGFAPDGCSSPPSSTRSTRASVRTRWSRAAGPGFEATARMTVSRPAYEIARNHALPQALARAATRACGAAVPFSAMTFWTDAAALGGAGIPSVLFGPGGAGLHGIEEYV